MKIDGKVAVVTGGASGIGFELCQRFLAEGATVVLSDLDEEVAAAKARSIGAFPVRADVGREADIANLVTTATEQFGRIDLFCSNAGIAIGGAEDVATSDWRRIYDVDVLAHVWAARYVLPQMLERQSGYLLNVASAAGLLMEFHSAPYTASKHAAVGFSEWLAATYYDQGIKVSMLCPAAVDTPIIAGNPSLLKAAISTREVADDVMAALAAETFMISTHPFVMDLFKLKVASYDEYLAAMRQQRTAWLRADSDGR